MGETLLDGEGGAVEIVNATGASPYVLVCEHASNRLPKSVKGLGLPAEVLNMHIAYDIGAESVARFLARLLDAPLILQRYSRLVYDCNRPPESDGAMPEMSELTAIPGNKGLGAEAKLQRLREIYWPFHQAVADLLDERTCAGKKSILVSVHSFTRVYKGKERSVELGILYDRDGGIASKLIKAFPNVDVRLNEPYGPKDGVLHTINMHAAPRGLKSVMLEIRNDLIANERGQYEWAQRLSLPLVMAAAK